VTYSIVAHDRETGELGVAVQSQAFNTGAAVPWAWPGVGAIATQSFTDRRYGWRGLELLADGDPPDDALARLRADDDLRELRQVGIVDAQGRVAQWTGERCVPEAGSAAGDGWAAQANMCAPRVWDAMGEAFGAADGPLARRLLAALDAAEAAGGDWRGRGGAGIVVVAAEGEPWERILDLRVEEGEDSLERLRELVERADGYRRWNRASGGGRVEIARDARLSAPTVAWSPIADALEVGELDEARRLFRALVAREPRWEAYARTLDAHPELPPLAPLFED
jgi:uncharacterized Ntn-hydrolase superfamily protein